MKKPSIVQLNNQFINEENLKRQYEAQEVRQKNRFIGWILILVTLFFILPAYNLVSNYALLEEKKAQIIELKQDYETLKEETKEQKEMAQRLQNPEYLEKYARAKYYYSLEGEVIYSSPELLPK